MGMTYAEQSDNRLQKAIIFGVVLIFEGALVMALMYGLGAPKSSPPPQRPPVQARVIKEPPPPYIPPPKIQVQAPPPPIKHVTHEKPPKPMPPAKVTPPPSSNTPVSDAPPVADHMAGSSPLNHVVPEYPEEMSDAGREGVVTVACDVETTGATSNCQVMSVKGGQAFADSALRAVRQSRYAPAVKNGVPVKEFHHLYTITFSLND
ncbi:energy transducer TonB [Novacetimonas pomaceti]|uniref:energy transducer TonB n=1 Tax=Novacetimonas pomaceti TaxID=2021998 RepID=UPI001C2DE0AA|nr:TonB family protein [Novacetimonas pomaceti]